ncbi:protein O-mannosyl-transferase TMTC4-like [Haliotis rubra]|uniref:protein O-mannosyl-transferase TMTC4-like n=1 Tax=Haliotis rubra TaxID=36100 RepID=UPI001EE5A478|nr:protein O-mannosyl-transferase TMTC4-like [Haliotis rubra]
MQGVAAKRGKRKTNENCHQSEWDDVLPVPKLSFSVASVLVFCLAVLCFANSYDGEFVFDDLWAITNNKDILPETPLTAIFSHDFWGQLLDEKSHKSYRPITVMTYRWNYAWAGGLHPRGFHVVNIVLHGLVSIIFLAVFSVLMSGYQVDQESARPVFASPRAALLCAVLFAVHPIHTESVAGVVGRADLLCALTFLLSFLLYARACSSSSCLVSYRPESFLHAMSATAPTSCHVSYRPESFSLMSILATSCHVSYRPESFSLVSILASMCLCVVSTFCKEQGITVIGICSVFDVIVVCRVDPFKWLSYRNHAFNKQFFKERLSPWMRSLMKRHLILFLTGASLLVTRIWIMGSTTPVFGDGDNPHSLVNGSVLRVINYNYLYAMHVWLLLNPWWLCFDWAMGCIPVITSLADPRILAVIALWTAFGVLIFHCCHGDFNTIRRILIMSLAMLGVPFLPASNLFFRVGFVIAERILYLSCAGFCMLVVLGARQICFHFHSTYKQRVAVGLTFLVVIFALRSIQRNNDWKTRLSLFTSGDKVCPRNAKIQFGLGGYHEEINNTDYAITKYRLAIELNPLEAKAMLNLAIILRRQGDVSEAKQLLEKSISINSRRADTWMNLAVVQAELNMTDLSEASFLESIRQNDTCSDCFFNLGNLYRDTGRSTEALTAWENATHLWPSYTAAWKNTLLLLADLKKYDKAIEVGKEALKALPKETDLMFNLANTYIMVDKFQESEDLFLAGLQIDPHSAKFHHNLGVLYHRWGKTEKAEPALTRAVQLNPKDATYLKNLQLIREKIRENV